MLEEAEDNLANVYYTEEKLKFTFDRFVEIHRSAHNDMLSVPKYIAPNPATRVRKLLTNIRSTNPTLLASIASVQTSTLLRNDFLKQLMLRNDCWSQHEHNCNTKYIFHLEAVCFLLRQKSFFILRLSSMSSTIQETKNNCFHSGIINIFFTIPEI